MQFKLKTIINKQTNKVPCTFCDSTLFVGRTTALDNAAGFYYLLLHLCMEYASILRVKYVLHVVYWAVLYRAIVRTIGPIHIGNYLIKLLDNPLLN